MSSILCVWLVICLSSGSLVSCVPDISRTLDDILTDEACTVRVAKSSTDSEVDISVKMSKPSSNPVIHVHTQEGSK